MCQKCEKPIVDVVINAINGFWHVDCFVCHRCNKKFEEGEGRKKEDGGVKKEEEEIKEEEKLLREERKKEGMEEEKRRMDERKMKEENEEKDKEGKIEQGGKEREEGKEGEIEHEEEGEGRENEEKRKEERRKKDNENRREDGHCSYTVKDDKLFHFECYKEEFFERCHVCKKFCENEYYQTEGKAVHEGCLETFKEWKKCEKEIEELNKKETGIITCIVILHLHMI